MNNGSTIARRAEMKLMNFVGGHNKDFASAYHSLRRKCDDPHANFQRIRKIKSKK